MDDHVMQDPTSDAHRPRLFDVAREAIRRLHYSRRTEETYLDWIRRFILFSGKRHPRDLGAAEVTAFLTDLATTRHVAAATQNQAFAALLFLYKEVIATPLPWLDGLVHAKPSMHKPTVLTADEARELLSKLRGTKWLMASLLYGAGLRLRECLKLRVKDLDFGYRQILIRDGKGAKDRITMLPAPLIEPLQAHLLRVKKLHDRDLIDGCGEVEMPDALAHKYPRAPYEWAWKFVFPSYKRSADRETGVIRRHHVYENYVIRGVKSPLEGVRA
jgi:integron integrase